MFEPGNISGRELPQWWLVVYLVWNHSWPEHLKKYISIRRFLIIMFASKMSRNVKGIVRIVCKNVMMVRKSKNIALLWNILLRKKFGGILKKFLWRWQSQSQWSSVVLMHSGFAYFCDESSGSWKILRKFEATAPSKCDVIYPKKIREQL